LQSVLAAVAFVGIAVALTLFVPLFVERGAMVLLLAAVVLSIWYGGWKPGLFSALLAIVAAAWVLPPKGSFLIESFADLARFVAFVVVAVLITLMHRSLENARRELLLSEQRFTASVEAARIAAWDQDLSTGVFWCSPTFETIFGRTPGEQKESYEGFVGYTHPDDQVRVRSAIADARPGNPEFEMDHRIVRADGEIRWIHTRGRVHFDEVGKPSRMIGIAADVTETRIRAADKHQPVAMSTTVA
jgi:PAS domain S-box-containing protein